MPDDFVKAKLMRTLGWSYVSAGKTEKAIKISEEAIILFKKIKEAHTRNKKECTYNIARSYNNIADAYERRGQLKLSQLNNTKCLRMMKRLKAWKWISGSYLNQSIVLRKGKKLDRSLKSSNAAMKIKNSILDIEEKPVLLYNEAFTMLLLYLDKRNAADLHHAIEHLEEAYNLRVQQGSTKECAAILALGFIATCFVYDQKSDLASAFVLDIQATELHKHKKDKQPLIAKARLLHALVCNDVPPASVQKLALAEKELPDANALYKRIKEHA